MVHEKAEVEQLMKLINKKLQEPSEAKKAAMIISSMLEKKK